MHGSRLGAPARGLSLPLAATTPYCYSDGGRVRRRVRHPSRVTLLALTRAEVAQQQHRLARLHKPALLRELLPLPVQANR
jgi:hypothetical protein